MHIAFTEKMILLDTGTFALSLTFLASFGSHTAARFAVPNLWLMYAAWGLLLASILSGGIHNFLRINASQHLFTIIAALMKAYRSDGYVRRMQAFSGLLRGELKPEEGDDFEEIDIGRLFEELGALGVTAFRKEAAEANSIQHTSSSALPLLLRTATIFDLAALLCTTAALLLLGIFAMRTAWILLQK